MANATKSRVNKNIKKNTKKVEEPQESSWYYFYSQGCGWCKKSEPVVDELNKEGYNILKLDLAEPDNQKIANEIKKEYNKQCGTPWFINAETGEGVCGFREKDILKKWLAGESIPEPPRPKGMPPRPPFMGATKKEENKWKKQYNAWLDDNQHLPEKQKRSIEEILSQPRPKSEPPKAPVGPETTEESIDKWGIEFGKWSKENSHLPNLQPVDVMVNNFKNRLKNASQQPNVQTSQATSPKIDELEKRIAELEAKPESISTQDLDNEDGLTEWEEDMEYKLDRLIEHLGVRV